MNETQRTNELLEAILYELKRLNAREEGRHQFTHYTGGVWDGQLEIRKSDGTTIATPSDLTAGDVLASGHDDPEDLP